MYQVLLVILLLVAVSLVGLILLQQGKGADMGASFGAGASATLFGAGGSGNFMTRMTAILASLFFIISLVLGNMAGNKSNGNQWQNLSDSSVTAPVVAPAPTASDAATVKPTSDIPK